MKLIEELENLLVKEIVDKTWQPKKLAKKINALYQENLNHLINDIESINLDNLRLKMDIEDLKRENIKLKYQGSGVYYCNCKEKVECWALQKNGVCATFENCQYKISEMEYELNKLKEEEK